MSNKTTRWLVLVATVLATTLAGCARPPERTDDPAEIEKLRKQHQATAQRELSDG